VLGPELTLASESADGEQVTVSRLAAR